MTFNMFCSTISVPKDILLIGSGWHTNKPYLVNIIVHFPSDFYEITKHHMYCIDFVFLKK